MKFIKEPRNFLGLSLVIALTFFGVGGLIAAIQGRGPSDAQITAIVGMISALIGGLIGKSGNSPGGEE